MIEFNRKRLLERFSSIRETTGALCEPLVTEDYVIQTIEDVSPPKWHLAHTTWFFETFILATANKNYQYFDKNYSYLFNSYYQTVGTPFPRAQRGLLSRPTVQTIWQYRACIDERISAFFDIVPDSEFTHWANLLELGLHHEQQHQELLLMDIKYNFFHHPSYPSYHSANRELSSVLPLSFSANRLITNGEFLEFIEAGGYTKPQYWLADGWELISSKKWQAPLYWLQQDKQWWFFTLAGVKPLALNEPVCHVSYYEADAFARWRGARLPSEQEWEHFAGPFSSLISGNFLESGAYHPLAESGSLQLFGDVWEWTASAYQAYPGFKPLRGSLGEYNGKFMCNQMVLRGGSCVTPRSHIRPTYRNFFQPDKRWMFGGIRLASDMGHKNV